MAIFKKLNGVHIGLILILPIILALINPNWMFSTNFLYDDYIYLGHFLDLYGQIGWYPTNEFYFYERITWTVPGAIIHDIFNPLIANFVLHLLVYWIAAFAIYGIIQRLSKNDRVALFITLLLGHYPPFMRAVGWDYLDGALIAYLSLCIFFIVQASISKRTNLYLVLAGAFGMIFISTNLFMVTYTPALLIFYWLYRKPKTLKVFIKDTLWVVLGAVVVYILLGFVYLHLTGNWLFFKNSLEFSKNFVGDKDPRIRLWQSSTKPQLWHILPAIVISSALWTLWKGRKTNGNPDIILLRQVLVLHLILYVPYVLFSLRGYIYLVYSFYSSPIIPVTFILFGTLIAPSFSRYDNRYHRLFIGMAYIVPALPFFVFSILPLITIPLPIITAILGPLIPLFIIFGITLPTRRAKRYALLVVGFSVLGYIVGISTHQKSATYTVPITYIYDRYEAQGDYEASVMLAEAINQRFPKDKSAFMFRAWGTSGTDDPERTIFSKLNMMFSGDIFRTFFEESELDRRIPKYIIALSSEMSEQEMIDQVETALNKRGYRSDDIETLFMEYSRGSFYVIFIKTTRLS